MIRRTQLAPDGLPRWVLIPQTEHARLSGQMAAAWGGGAYSRLDPYEEMVAAAAHHDDGWAAWEQHSDVDPATGRPLDFTEMPVPVSLEIWRGSIQSARRYGPLAAWAVSGHFSALMQRFPARWQGGSDEDRTLAEAFLSEQERLREQLLIELAGSRGPDEAKRQAQLALAYVQLFDALSLWLCCQERTQAETFPTPTGSPLVLTPASSGRIVVQPWPFAAEALDLSATGRAVPQAFYADADALAAAPSESVSLAWHLSATPA